MPQIKNSAILRGFFRRGSFMESESNNTNDLNLMKISEYASKLKEEIKNRVSNKISDKLESYKSANEKDADNGLDMENGRQDEIREA